MKFKLRILGIRGVPGRHGGFETFAEHLALYLVDRGWEVTVYNQEAGDGEYFQDEWQGIKRIHIPVSLSGAKGTVVFDWKSIVHASRSDALVLTLGYNTAMFDLLFRLKGVPNIKNMDGLEWRRDKWGWFEKTWLYANERVACWLANHLVADHPKIKEHIETRVKPSKVTMIPYGAPFIDSADSALIENFGVKPCKYALVVARPEPENSVLEIVRGFSKKERGNDLVVLGDFDPAENSYHSEIIAAASHEVKFPGAVYSKPLINALRYYSRLYIHGHTVGGTNPSLVEALGAGSPVLAHDNEFNRWVAGEGGRYFVDEGEFADCIDAILDDDDVLSKMTRASRLRFEESFGWTRILEDYEQLLANWA